MTVFIDVDDFSSLGYNFSNPYFRINFEYHAILTKPKKTKNLGENTYNLSVLFVISTTSNNSNDYKTAADLLKQQVVNKYHLRTMDHSRRDGRGGLKQQ